ncbi:helix-turn-helix transcriptional regulator [Crenobacter caeni]|uniref:WYL domain-containing protein n=1 Tax=Crenobacter caeni TaxID=2705474 RepID=A0A6B2KV31_9NEIS|nr:WYL domain-containing protein [Crenobacter caeni]NDV13807.1 WYL domain-containing protein [Crenobacter caeni]
MDTIPANLGQLTHNQRQRLSFLEFCLYFLGEVRRADLMARFDVAPAVATRDFALYRQLAPDNLLLDPSSKAYFIQPGFAPLFGHRLEQVLAALMQGEPYSIEAVGAALLPGDYPALLNRPQLPILAAVSRAIRQQRLMRIRYHSESSGEQERLIAPHALVDSGLRWHVRAFDRLRGAFIDLVLTRILSAELLAETPAPHEQPAADRQWQTLLTLELVPHPRLGHPAVAALDYALADGRLSLPVRAVSAGYLLRRWNVDASPDAASKDPACRLWLANPDVLAGVDSAVLAPGWPAAAAEHPEFR